MAFAQEQTLHRLKLPLPEGWLILPADVGPGKRIVPPGSQALIVSTPPQNLEGSLEDFLVSFLANLEGDMTPVGGTLAETFESTDGLQGISQARLSRGEQGQELYSLTFALQVDASVQVVYLAAPNEQEFQDVALPLAKAVKAAEAATLPAIVRSEQSEAGSTLHAAAKNSSKESINCELAWSQVLEVSTSALKFCRGADGTVHWLAANSGIADEAQKLWSFSEAEPESVPGEITLEAAEAVLQSKDKALPQGWVAEGFTHLQTDSRSNLVLGVGEKTSDAFLFWDTGSRKLEAMVTPSFLAGVAEQLGRDCGVKLSLAPNGDAWLLIYTKAEASTDLEASLRVYRLERTSEDNWRAFRVALQLGSQAGRFALPTQLNLAGFGPDWNGGLVFAGSDALWRMDSQGRLSPLAEFDTALLDQVRSEPVVQRNGDLWFFNKGNSLEQTRGELLRLRFRQGELEIGRVDSKSLSTNLGLQEPVSDMLLRHDFSNGGLLGFDPERGLLFSLVPED